MLAWPNLALPPSLSLQVSNPYCPSRERERQSFILHMLLPFPTEEEERDIFIPETEQLTDEEKEAGKGRWNTCGAVVG